MLLAAHEKRTFPRAGSHYDRCAPRQRGKKDEEALANNRVFLSFDGMNASLK